MNIRSLAGSLTLLSLLSMPQPALHSQSAAESIYILG
jgi:hypothetical protein